MKLSGTPPDEVVHAWEDVKAMFNGGTRKRMLSAARYVTLNYNRSRSKRQLKKYCGPISTNEGGSFDRAGDIDAKQVEDGEQS